jgi:hypothetical protein
MKEEILKLKSGEHYVVPESDYGKAEVWRVNDIYILFEIPLFGGDPRFHCYYFSRDIDLIVETIEAWT